MIDRYTRPAMGAIWTEEAQFQSWLDVELAACWAWAKATDTIPMEDVETLYEQASFNIDRIHEIEQATRHDVVAFTRAVSETLGEEKKWVHYGLTSSDVVDTALSLRLHSPQLPHCCHHQRHHYYALCHHPRCHLIIK